MKPFEQTAKISPLPTVDLDVGFEPNDGWQIELSKTCRKHLSETSKCTEYYRSLQGDEVDFGLHQCPFGFSTFKFRAGESEMCITGFVPFPRLGGAKEKIIAKRHPKYKFTTQSVEQMINNLRVARRSLQAVEDETVNNYSLALHEIRKLNRTVVQNAERVCRKESPNNPENAPREILSVWKAAELMARQFDVVEILANQSLTELPLKSVIEPYRIFDKCVKVYRTLSVPKRLQITANPYNYSPKVLASDKTFSIIPTVLIENAIKYSVKDSEIRINIEPRGTECSISVSSESNNNEILDESVFKRGVRATSDKDGSGNGLYVAQLIAHQHKTKISVQSEPITIDRIKHTFSLLLKTIMDRR